MYKHHIMHIRILRFSCYTPGLGILVNAIQDQSLCEGVAEGSNPVHRKSLIISWFHYAKAGAYSRRSGREWDKQHCHTAQHVGEEGGSDIGFISLCQFPVFWCSLCGGYLVQCPPTRTSGGIFYNGPMHGEGR
jgi:hypothetical protein